MADDPHEDDEMWIYKKHTRAKHEVLQYYLDIWIKKVSNERRTLRVFDCFAGRGDYVDSKDADPIDLDTISTSADYPGSPLVILDKASEYSHLFDSVECYFFEPKSGNREDLKKNLEGTEGDASNVHTNVIPEKFEEGVIKTIRQNGGFSGFGFFFIDPFGIQSIPFSIISKITSTPKFDCIINLQTGHLVPWSGGEDYEKTNEIVYGTANARDEIESMEVDDPITAEAEYYCHRLEEAGTEYTIDYMLTEGTSRNLKYHHIFTSNSEHGFKHMRDAMMYCGTKYTLAYAPERPEFHGDRQATLAGGHMLTEAEKAKGYLLSKFAAKSLTFDELVKQCYIDRPRSKSLQKHYLKYLKQMHDEGKVQIPERDSDSLRKTYTIYFPEEEQV